MRWIRDHSENGWSTLGPKLFLELLLPGLQETHNSRQYTVMLRPEDRGVVGFGEQYGYSFDKLGKSV